MKVVSQNDPDFYAKGGWGHTESAEQRWLTRHIVTPYDLQEGQTLLDLGCGDGLHARLFARKGLVVTAVDSNPESVRFAIERAALDEKLSESEGMIKFLVCDVTVPLGLGQSDYVFSRGLPQIGYPSQGSAAKVMATIHDALKPGGLAFILRTSDGSGEDSDGSFPGSRVANPTLEAFQAMVSAAGFEILESKMTGKLVFVAGRK